MHTFRVAIAVIAIVYVSLMACAIAQQMPQPSPQDQVQALSGQIIDEMQQVLQWRTRAIADEAQIAQLQAQIAKLTKPAK